MTHKVNLGTRLSVGSQIFHSSYEQAQSYQ